MTASTQFIHDQRAFGRGPPPRPEPHGGPLVGYAGWNALTICSQKAP
jgi:hypothetical protein